MESSHLYIYTPGLPHRGEELGLTLQDVKIKVAKVSFVSLVAFQALSHECQTRRER